MRWSVEKWAAGAAVLGAACFARPVGAASVTIEENLNALLPEHRERIIDLYTEHPSDWPEGATLFPTIETFLIDAYVEGDSISLVLLHRWGIPDTSVDPQTAVELDANNINIDVTLVRVSEVGATVVMPLIVSILITGVDPGTYNIDADFRWWSESAEVTVASGGGGGAQALTTPSPAAATAGLALLGALTVRRRAGNR